MGNYQSKVLPFGLTGGPATFQRYINSTLVEYLNQFITAYIDNVIIFSKSKEEHIEHVNQVLQKLQEAGLQVDVRKSEFIVTETKFLGLIILTKGLKIDNEKIQVIQEWNTPTSLLKVQSFVGFYNFYRRFIKDFSKILRPLIELTKKSQPFNWSPQCQEAFEYFKEQVTKAPILLHFDYTKQYYLEVDSSDYVQGGVLSQKDNNGLLHPVAFFSRKLLPAKYNYKIYDKELLAIVNALEHWRPELEGTELPIQILTDHKALEYFMTTKKLNRRQAR
jgi:CRISPR/Cas system CMR-associated protein Cmr5 small subunit